jgi:hypothetical protein
MGLDPLGAREQRMTASICLMYMYRERQKINKDKIHKFICLNIESTVTLRLLPARMQKKKSNVAHMGDAKAHCGLVKIGMIREVCGATAGYTRHFSHATETSQLKQPLEHIHHRLPHPNTMIARNSLTTVP